jgi:signal peptidase II
MHVLFWSVALVVFALDLFTKWAVFRYLANRSYAPVIDDIVRLVTVYNNGAAFGLFAGHPDALLVVSFLALAAVICVFLFGGLKEKVMNVALALFAAGISGNLYDRLFNNGLVRDFIDMGISQRLRWPAFNLADASLCTAVGLMLISICFTETLCRRRAPQQK